MDSPYRDRECPFRISENNINTLRFDPASCAKIWLANSKAPRMSVARKSGFGASSAGFPSSHELDSRRSKPFPEIAGVVRNRSGHQYVRLGEAAIRDADDSDVRTRRDLRKDSGHAVDVLLELGLSVRPGDVHGFREVNCNDKVEMTLRSRPGTGRAG